MQQSSGGGAGKKVAIIVVVIILLALIAGGFVIRKIMSAVGGVVAEKALEGATGGKVDINGGKVTIKGENGGTVTYGDTSLPADWPSDAPVYPGAKITFSGSSSANADGKTAATVALTTSDSSDKVSSYYKDQIAAKGWTIKGTAQAQGTTSISAEKDTRQLIIIIGASENLTSISISTGTK